MAGGNGNGGEADYTRARTFVGVALGLVAVVIALIDTLRTDVTIDAFQFFGILGAATLFLGVRGLDRFIKP